MGTLKLSIFCTIALGAPTLLTTISCVSTMKNQRIYNSIQVLFLNDSMILLHIHVLKHISYSTVLYTLNK